MKGLGPALYEISRALQSLARATEELAAALESGALPEQIVREEEVKELPVEPLERAEETALSPQAIQAYLAQRNIQLNSFVTLEQIASSEVEARLALFLGDFYDDVQNLYEKMKRALNTGGSFFLNFRDAPQLVISRSVDFAHKLHRAGYLKWQNYRKAPRYELMGEVNLIPPAINFLTGGWLEIYVAHILQRFAQNGAFIAKAKIQFPSGAEREVDFFGLLYQNPVWIECTTADFQIDLDRYIEIQKRFKGIKDMTCLLVVPYSIKEETREHLRSLRGIYLLNAAELGGFLMSLKPEEKKETALDFQQKANELSKAVGE